MNAVPRLIREVEDAIARGTPPRRVQQLRRVTDLFLRDAPALTDEQIDLFDVVIARLASAIEARARLELAERLADAANAPRGVIRSLAHDTIDVARPVLMRSSRLSDEDLVAVAIAKGQEHRLAIARRAVVAEPVSDVLVKRAERVVVHALAANPGARFTPVAMGDLVERSRADEGLQEILHERGDLPDEHLRQLVAVARETARRRIAADPSVTSHAALATAVEIGASAVRAEMAPGGRDLGEAYAHVSALAAERPIVEADVAEFAREGRTEETICAVAFAAGLELASAERLFQSGDSELLLVVARAEGWSLATLDRLLRLREPNGAAPHLVKRARDAFEHLRPQTAQRVVQFLKAREAAQKRQAEAAALRQETRENVR